MDVLQSTMYDYEKSILHRITKSLRERSPDRITAIYVFGSKVMSKVIWCAKQSVSVLASENLVRAKVNH